MCTTSLVYLLTLFQIIILFTGLSPLFSQYNYIFSLTVYYMHMFVFFRANVLNNLEASAFNKPICEALLNQKYFNGIGNYLRAEVLYRYSLIQMKCQGGNKYVLSISVKFDQSTRRFGRISFARLFKLTKHITLLFYLLSPYLLSCMRGSRNVIKNMHIIKTIMKLCAHWSTVCQMTISDAGGIRTQ